MHWVLLAGALVVIAVVTVAVIFVLWKMGASEVYLYYDSTSNFSSLSEARNKAIEMNGEVAHPSQVLDAQKAGASWCAAGWASDGNVYWPQQSNPPKGCGSPGVNPHTCANFNNSCGVLIYGKKPPSGTSGVLPFNASQWSQWKWYNPFH